jgi:predicted Zn-dependent protease with MMP-like domain
MNCHRVLAGCFDDLVFAVRGNRDRAFSFARIRSAIDEFTSHGILLKAGLAGFTQLHLRGRRFPRFAEVSSVLTRAEFERVVAEALDSLPERFARLVENVAIAVEEEPTAEDLESIEDDSDGDDDEDSELLGIYRGVALTDRTHDMPLLPDEIAVFRGPINRFAHTRQEAVEEVRETVIHELGHYFGLHDEELP